MGGAARSWMTWLVQPAFFTILMNLGVAVALTVLAVAFGALHETFRHHMAEMLDSTPVADFDLCSGWQRTNANMVALHTLDRRFDVQTSWRSNLTITAVSGLSDNGKTTTPPFLAAHYDVRLCGMQPHHGEAEDSLGTTLNPLRGTAGDRNRAQRITRYAEDTMSLILCVNQATRLLRYSTLGLELNGLLK